MANNNNKKNELETFRELLTAKRSELAARIEQRREEIIADHEPEDEGGLALRNASAGIAIANIERDVRALSEIDLCLRLMDKGEYGICAVCEEKIPAARLRAIPWARRCIDCAGGGVRSSGAPHLDPGFAIS